MELRARKVQQMHGAVMPAWFKKWILADTSGKQWGTMLWNGAWEHNKFVIYIDHPLHEDLGHVAHAQFEDRAEALAWARGQIENIKPLTVKDLDLLLNQITSCRYQDEQSDDYAYSNGKVARWDRLAGMVLAEIRKLEAK